MGATGGRAVRKVNTQHLWRCGSNFWIVNIAREAGMHRGFHQPPLCFYSLPFCCLLVDDLELVSLLEAQVVVVARLIAVYGQHNVVWKKEVVTCMFNN